MSLRRRSRGTGPRATVSGTVPFTVGRGFVPRRAPIAGKPARIRGGPRGHALRSLKRSRGTGPRATVSGTASLTVGRGPVPRRALGHARDRGGNPLGCACGIRGPPRYGEKNGYFCRFTSPNVVSIRFDAETGPRNSRVANVAGLPSNATSSI